jgi:hypothetical protein
MKNEKVKNIKTWKQLQELEGARMALRSHTSSPFV